MLNDIFGGSHVIKFLARVVILFSILIATPANAAFHLWGISEIYSNADGSVQFIELTAFSGGQQFLAGQTLTSSQGTQNNRFTFPSNLPGDTAGKTMLIGTQGFAALNLVTPDYTVPNGFLFTTNGSINFANVDIVNYASLPTTGGLSINASSATAVNSPKNFAGATGTIPAAAPGPLNYSDMWWAGTAEDGWGMSIQQHGNIQFVAI